MLAFVITCDVSPLDWLTHGPDFDAWNVFGIKLFDATVEVP